MQIILASAKIMNDKPKSVPDVSLSTPYFQSEAESFGWYSAYPHFIKQ